MPPLAEAVEALRQHRAAGGKEPLGAALSTLEIDSPYRYRALDDERGLLPHLLWGPVNNLCRHGKRSEDEHENKCHQHNCI